jgi:Glycosyl transferase family 21
VQLHIPDILTLMPLAAWLFVAALACIAVYNMQRDRRPPVVDRPTGAVLIIPVRGVPPQLDALWRGICAQTDPPRRVIFSVESAEDPAYQALQSLGNGPPMEIVIAGATIQRSQKVHNQLAALRTLQPNDAVVVFADADIAPDANWLAKLTCRLDDGRVVSGCRWLVPTDERWATAFVCVLNSSVATLPRRGLWNLVWGGSMALRRATIDALDLEKCWDRAASDDLSLSRTIKARGLRAYGPRDGLVGSPASYGWKEAIAFGRRQYLFLRIHAPAYWAVAACGTTLPLIGWAVAVPLAVTGNMVALGVIATAIALDRLRAQFRDRMARKLWGAGIQQRVAWLDRWGTPAYLAVHAMIIWSTLFGRTITWAGRRYTIDRQHNVIGIESVDDTRPSGAARHDDPLPGVRPHHHQDRSPLYDRPAT